MGGSVSTGKNNDDLIDHLVEAEFIRTPLIQQIFRSVDRGNYYCADQRGNAYKDIAWRMGNLHLSAPCVYSEVMEALRLRPGLSFLNLGSGSGYLSTMAGLMLGTYGINHGIELYRDIVDFAYDRLDEFIGNSNAVDEYDFCEPSFMVGNFLLLDGSCQQYDRVYCGASCIAEYEPYIKNLVKIGGILIMPLNEKLLKITRTGESTWSTVKLLSVSFAPLIAPPPPNGPVKHIKLANFCPPKLKHICRSNIRGILKRNIDRDHPNVKNNQTRLEIKHRRRIRRIVIPIFDESDVSNHSQSNSDFECDSDNPEFTINSRIPTRMSILLEDFLRRHAELQTLSETGDFPIHTDSSDSDTKPAENSEEKDDSENCELTYSASFFSMSDKSISTEDSKSILSSPEKSGPSDPTPEYYKSVSTEDSKSILLSPEISGPSDPTPELYYKSVSTEDSKSILSSREKSMLRRPHTPPPHSYSRDSIEDSKSILLSPEISGPSDPTPELYYKSASTEDSKSILSSREKSMYRGPHTPPHSYSRDSDEDLGVEPPPRFLDFEESWKKACPKRKRPASEVAGTSGSVLQKPKRRSATVVWKRIIHQGSDSEMEEEPKICTKVDENETYTKHIVQRIAGLPLPSPLLRYLNYSRNNM